MALTAKKVYAILKRQISDMEAKIKTPIIYRGTVATADLLPLNPDIGDMYNIESKSVYGEAGMNVAWNGVVWDTMGAPIDMSLYIKSSELADWVKQQNKPTYTAEEVGALPADTKIPSKTSDLQNDSGFLTKIPDNYLSGTDKTLSVSGKAADAKAVGDKNVELLADISNKLNKNQGSENSGKIAGINESGDIVPMFPVSVDYNEETNCLEFGSDQKMELNQGIGLDSTLTKTGYAADAGVVGEITNSLKEDIGDLENLKYRELYDNLFYDFFDIATNKSGNINEYGNAQHIFVENVYSNGAKLESGNYLVALKLTNISLKRQVNVDASFALCIIDGWNKKYLGDIQYYNGEKELFVYSIINFTNDNNIKVSPALILNGGFESNSEYSFDVDTIAIIKNNTNGLPESIFHYGNNKIYPVFNMYGNLSNFKNAYILNKKLVANDTSGTSDVSAQYTVAKMGNTVNKIMLKGIFDTNTTIAIITEPNGMTNVTDVTNRSIHVTFSANGCSVGYFDNKALTNIKNISWDGDYIGKEVTIGFEISGNVITVYLPNGNTLTVTNEKLISCGGKYALWEHYMGGLNKRIFHSAQFTKIYAEDADGNVLCDDFNRENGSIGISPQGYVYAQFTNENQTGWTF
jgi:hypothetical protein